MASTVATSSSAVTKPYLQQCVEDLNPAVISSFQRKSRLWQVASIATIVGYSVLAASTFYAVAMIAPIYVPIAGMTALLLLGRVNKVYKHCDLRSDQTHARAKQLKDVKRNYEELSPLTPVQLMLKLQEKGILLSPIEHNPAQLERLKPLLARHQFWEGHVRQLEMEMQLKLDEATDLATADPEKNQADIYELHCHALELERQALQAKIKNAFVNAVIHRPTFAGTLENIGTFSKMTGQDRVIGQAVHATSVNEFFSFKRAELAALTANEIKQLSVADLGTRLIAAM